MTWDGSSLANLLHLVFLQAEKETCGSPVPNEKPRESEVVVITGRRPESAGRRSGRLNSKGLSSEKEH